MEDYWQMDVEQVGNYEIVEACLVIWGIELAI